MSCGLPGLKTTIFESCYLLSEGFLKDFIRGSATNIEVLSLNYCNWLTGKVLENCLPKCKNLKTLSIIDCNLTSKRLCIILGSLQKLKHVAFSVQDVADFGKEIDEDRAAQKCIANIEKLCLHIRNEPQGLRERNFTIQFLRKPTLFEYCRNLQSVYVMGNLATLRSFPKNLFEPVIVNADNVMNVREFGTNFHTNPSARAFYFGFLFEACVNKLQFKTLMIPTVIIDDIVTKGRLIESIEDLQDLENLDFSKSLEALGPLLHLQTAKNLRYLNLCDSRLCNGAETLEILAENCPHLLSLNIHNSNFVNCANRMDPVMDIGLVSLAAGCQKLKHLNISGVHLHQSRTTEIITAFKDMESLSISPCSFISRTVFEIDIERSEASKKRPLGSGSNLFGKRRRIGLQTSKCSSEQSATTSSDPGNRVGMTDSDLYQVVKSCPNMRKFELIGAGFRSGFHKTVAIQPKIRTLDPCPFGGALSDDIIACISKWHHLKSLQLSGLPGIRPGTTLITIAKGCVNLEQLFLSYLGFSGHCMYTAALFEACKYLKNLKDLRIEQPYLNFDHNFSRALQHCKSLERFCLISKEGEIDSASVMKSVEVMKKLMVVQLLSGATLVLSKTLQADLVKRFQSERPGLSIFVFPLLHDDIAEMALCVPMNHLADMTTFGSSVAQMPPNFSWW